MDLASALILGIVYVAAPGPIGVETLRQGMKGGFAASLAVQAGSIIGLIFYALLAFFGAGLLLQGTTWQLAAGTASIAVLIYLGITTIRDGRNLAIQTGDRESGGTSARQAFGSGAILSLANPLEIIFWLSLGSRVQGEPGLDGRAFLGAFFLGCLVTAVVIVLFASFWRSRLNHNAALALSWVCGLALIAFGLKLGLSLGRHLIGW
jgi:chemosensory pili system protein ChpE